MKRHSLTLTIRVSDKTVRVPDNLYEALREVRLALESQYQSAAPTVQDLVTVALERLIRDWQTSDQHPQLLDELLERRKVARSKMGRKNAHPS